MEYPVVPSGFGETDFVIRRSRFIAAAGSVRTADEARGRLREVRAVHPKAHHVVWAYILGDDRALRGMSDDGEPHGTAGRPVLSVLDGSGVTDVLVWVVRYFGGTKLGTGGLVSAYGRAAREALAATPTRRKIPVVPGRVRLSYPAVDAFKRWIRSREVRVIDEDYGETASFYVEIPRDGVTEFEKGILDLTSGTAHFEPDSGDDGAPIG